jgi:ABC-type branched-subunit amino acid transport system substrate-binding protein
LQRAVNRWAKKISGVVGTTNVPESTYLGELCERLGLLCLVSNNNPAVWNHRRSVFHIGVPTSSTTRAVANHLLRKVRAKRVYLLHDTTYFQNRVARGTATLLKKGAAVVRSKPGSQKNWLDDVRRWKPEALYLIYSSPALALPLVRQLRRALPETPVLLGRSLLRETFLRALGPAAAGVILLDLFRRGAPRTKEEALFMKVLHKEGISIPTANHGFGWDAVVLCARALTAAKGDPSAAIECLESGVLIDGATGLFRFTKNNHNGRARFNPTTFSRLRKGRVERLPERQDSQAK